MILTWANYFFTNTFSFLVGATWDQNLILYDLLRLFAWTKLILVAILFKRLVITFSRQCLAELHF
jgi:hypothetical protein